MKLFAPTALWLSLALPAIVLLYLLRRRRQDVPVSSTWLWQQALAQLEAAAPWQRLKRNLLMYLQLLVVALLVLAAARPYFAAPVAAHHLVLLLDASASMQATDVAPSRWERAVARARELIDGLGPRDRMTLIRMGGRPQVLLADSADKPRLRAALEKARPGFESADLGAALQLAAAAATGGGDGRGGPGAAAGEAAATAVVLSDGRLAPPDVAARGVAVRFEPIGTPAENWAITAFAVQAGARGASAVVRVARYGGNAAPARATIEIVVDGRIAWAQPVSLESGGQRDGAVPDLPAARSYEARLGFDPGMADALAADNAAWAVGAGAESTRVLLVSRGNVFLERALALFPGAEVVRMTPDQWRQGGVAPSGYRLAVLDGVEGDVPDALVPRTDLLWWNPPPGQTAIEVGTAGTVAELQAGRADDELLRDVDLAGVRIARAQSVQARWGRPLLRARLGGAAEASPIAWVGEEGGRKLAAFGFVPHQSDLPLRPAFPVLVHNLLRWMLPERGETGATARVGEPLPVQAAPGVDAATIITPDGSRVPLDPARPFTDTGRPGLYQVEQRQAGGATERRHVAVNFFSPLESDLAVASVLPQPRSAGGSGAQTGASARTGTSAPAPPLSQRELWTWLAWLALAGLMAEWWVFARAR